LTIGDFSGDKDEYGIKETLFFKNGSLTFFRNKAWKKD